MTLGVLQIIANNNRRDVIFNQSNCVIQVITGFYPATRVIMTNNNLCDFNFKESDCVNQVIHVISL